jgi:hypothetical protein
MIARMPRPAAITLALIVAAIAAWCLSVPPPPIAFAQPGTYTDARLYREIAAAVASGEPYYHAAERIQRAHLYPLKPFMTVRPPTLAWWAAATGTRGLALTGAIAALASLMAWIIASSRMIAGTGILPIERVGIALAVAIGSVSALNPMVLVVHECLAGLCLSIAMAGVLGWPRTWWLIMAPLAVGLAIRELVLPFVLLVLAFAIVERRWREASAWLGLIVAWAVLMAWHARRVASLWHPGDQVSQGWIAIQGFSGFLNAQVHTSALVLLPLQWSFLGAFLPMIGWLALDGRAGRFGVLAVAGYALMLSVFTRPDTFYWGAIMLPWYFAGYGLVPRAVVQLASAIAGKPKSPITHG